MYKIFSLEHPEYFFSVDDQKVDTELLKDILSITGQNTFSREIKKHEDYISLQDKIASFDLGLAHPYIAWLETYLPVVKTITQDFQIPDKGYWNNHKFRAIETKKKVAGINLDLENFADDYFVIDVETTGLNPELDSVIQFSAVEYKNNLVVNKTNFLIHPSIETELTTRVSEITGITDEMISDKPSFKDLFETINTIISSGKLLVGHNFSFDLSMLENEYQRLDKEFPPVIYSDTLKLARKFIPYRGAGQYKLEELKKDLPEEDLSQLRSHDSLNDALITGSLFKLIKTKAGGNE